MHTSLSPQWDRGFGEAFTDLVSHDEDLVRAEFASLTRAVWPGGWTPDRRSHPPLPRQHPGDGS